MGMVPTDFTTQKFTSHRQKSWTFEPLSAFYHLRIIGNILQKQFTRKVKRTDRNEEKQKGTALEEHI